MTRSRHDHSVSPVSVAASGGSERAGCPRVWALALSGLLLIIASPLWAAVVLRIDAPPRANADGRSTCVVTVHAFDPSGGRVDGTTVNFTTSLGSITPASEIRNGIATAVLTSGASPGTAIVSAMAGGSRQDVEIEFTASGAGDSPGPAAVASLEGHEVAFNRDSVMATATGGVFEYGATTVRAAAIQWQMSDATLTAQGGVEVACGKETLRGEALSFRYQQGSGFLMRFEGDATVVSSFRVPAMTEAVVEKPDLELFRPLRERPSRLIILTKQVSIRPDGHAVFDSATLLIDEVKVLSLPHYAMNALGGGQSFLENAVRTGGGSGLTADLPFYYVARPGRIGSLRMTYNTTPEGVGLQRGWGLNLEEQYLLGNSGRGTFGIDDLTGPSRGLRWTHSQQFSPAFHGFSSVRSTRIDPDAPRLLEANTTLSRSLSDLFLDLSLRASSYAESRQYQSFLSARSRAARIGSSGFSYSTSLRLNYSVANSEIPVSVQDATGGISLTTEEATSSAFSETLSFHLSAPSLRVGRGSITSAFTLANTWSADDARPSVSALAGFRHPIGRTGHLGISYSGQLALRRVAEGARSQRHVFSLSLNAQNPSCWNAFSFASVDASSGTLFASGSLRYWLPFGRSEEDDERPWSVTLAGLTSKWYGRRNTDLKMGVARALGNWDVSLNYSPQGNEFGSGLSTGGSTSLFGANTLSGYGYTQDLGRTVWLEISPRSF